MADGPNKVEYTFDREQLRMALETTMDADLVEGMNFRIESITGGTQRDPELVGVRAVWWRPQAPIREGE